MKNIKVKHLGKYDSNEYIEIAYSVYKNNLQNNYCFAYEAELEENEGQYPLENLLDQYSVSCTEYYGEEEIIDGIKKASAEVETLSDSKEDLIKIFNFSTIIDKIIENAVYCGTELLVLKYGTGKIIQNNQKEISIPIFAKRNDITGRENFEIKYPEIQYKKMFESGINVPNSLPEISTMEYILLENSKANVIYKIHGETYRLIYGLKGYEQNEKIEETSMTNY